MHLDFLSACLHQIVDKHSIIICPPSKRKLPFHDELPQVVQYLREVAVAVNSHKKTASSGLFFGALDFDLLTVERLVGHEAF